MIAARRMRLAHLALLATLAATSAVAAETDRLVQAQRALFPEADRFVRSDVELSREQKKEIQALSGVRQRNDRQPVWRAQNAGQVAGWFIVDEVIGKHEFITYAAGLLPDGSVRGIEVLAYRETYGGEIRSDDWRARLAGKRLSDPWALDVDVPAISGATLSCRNVANGVKRLLALQKVALPSP